MTKCLGDQPLKYPFKHVCVASSRSVIDHLALQMEVIDLTEEDYGLQGMVMGLLERLSGVCVL